MNELPKVQRVLSGKAATPAGVASSKMPVYLMAVLVITVMIAWLGFLGWAVFAVIRSLIGLAFTAS